MPTTILEEQLFIPDDYSNGRGSYWYCWRASGSEQLVPVTGIADKVLIGTHPEEQWFIPDDCNNRPGTQWRASGRILPAVLRDGFNQWKGEKGFAQWSHQHRLYR
jgi:hypothetical protein